MKLQPLRTLFEQVRAGKLSVDEAERQSIDFLRELPFEDLGFARVDHHRAIRQGFPEVVLGIGKTPAQIASIAQRIANRGQSVLVTRTDEAAYDAVLAVLPAARFHPEARAITFPQDDCQPGKGVIVIATDVGVAGIHRLLSAYDRLTRAHVVIVVAGMEGALPSVVGGLVQVPVIGVPTSTGYGASFEGVAALLGMLNSCAAGVSVVNIDNGFGAATIASLINHL